MLDDEEEIQPRISALKYIENGIFIEALGRLDMLVYFLQYFYIFAMCAGVLQD